METLIILVKEGALKDKNIINPSNIAIAALMEEEFKELNARGKLKEIELRIVDTYNEALSLIENNNNHYLVFLSSSKIVDARDARTRFPEVNLYIFTAYSSLKPDQVTMAEVNDVNILIKSCEEIFGFCHKFATGLFE